MMMIYHMFYIHLFLWWSSSLVSASILKIMQRSIYADMNKLENKWWYILMLNYDDKIVGLSIITLMALTLYRDVLKLD